MSTELNSVFGGGVGTCLGSGGTKFLPVPGVTEFVKYPDTPNDNGKIQVTADLICKCTSIGGSISEKVRVFVGTKKPMTFLYEGVNAKLTVYLMVRKN